jgi:hypothetical protein
LCALEVLKSARHNSEEKKGFKDWVGMMGAGEIDTFLPDLEEDFGNAPWLGRYASEPYT